MRYRSQSFQHYDTSVGQITHEMMELNSSEANCEQFIDLKIVYDPFQFVSTALLIIAAHYNSSHRGNQFSSEFNCAEYTDAIVKQA